MKKFESDPGFWVILIMIVLMGTIIFLSGCCEAEDEIVVPIEEGVIAKYQVDSVTVWRRYTGDTILQERTGYIRFYEDSVVLIDSTWLLARPYDGNQLMVETYYNSVHGRIPPEPIFWSMKILRLEIHHWKLSHLVKYHVKEVL